MRPPVRAAAGGVAALLLVGAVAGGSRVPLTFSGEGDARVRLSWRMTGVTAEACRTLSPEELERLPVHMRNPQACIGVIAPYTLRVEVDRVLSVEDTIRPPGARGDRPLNVLRDFALPPGRHHVEVSFRAVLPEGVEPPPGGVTELAWRGEVVLAGREVALLTLDASGRALELRER